MTRIKEDIVRDIMTRTFVDQKTAKNLINSILCIIKDELASGEKDRPVLSPAVVARVTGMSEEKVREAIERQRDELNLEGLFEMPEIESDFLN